MRAVRRVSSGRDPGLRIDSVADPSPGPGEVVVALRAAALNRRDSWLLHNESHFTLPFTPGSDGAGVVDRVGPGVPGLAAGLPVVINPSLNWERGSQLPPGDVDILGGPRDGTLAEQVVVPARNVYPKPQRLTFEEAAALNLAGLTAFRAAVTCADVEAGHVVLVTGIGGGVGIYALQICRQLGARVLVTSSDRVKLDHAAALGAEAGFDYSDPRWPTLVLAASGGGVDVVIDGAGRPAWAQSLPILNRGGTLVSYGATAGPDCEIDAFGLFWRWQRIVGTSMGSPEDFDGLLAHVERASWRPVVDSVFALDDVDSAMARLDDPNRFGKVVVAIS